MPKKIIKNENHKNLSVLVDCLNYLNMQEIKDFCLKHQISMVGKKGIIIARIKHYLKTGKILQPKAIPEISMAKCELSYPLKPETKILKGNYKNDLKTRQFMKKLIGSHFHFTAFGQDWIRECWEKGKPPTYQEYAKMWEKEYLKRKNEKANPRQEWAYLNFIQRYINENAIATREEIVKAWEKERSIKAKIALEILNKYAKK